ncbi:hypothetical protein CASFOL_030990 [Castilleja foliolosa]|uniref:Uncharacterized protein n=1 Tax=Castilleja foliolosa TaxID=1961234 RepID=A0ABD3C6X7_9LAMI
MLGVGRLDMIKALLLCLENMEILSRLFLPRISGPVFNTYATLEQAQRAIGAFNIPYTFPKVRYAERERERERERFGDYLLDENYILVSRLL